MTLKCVVCGEEAEYVDVHSYCKKCFEERQKSFEKIESEREHAGARITFVLMMIGANFGLLVAFFGVHFSFIGTLGTVIVGGVAGAFLGELLERHHLRRKE